MKIRILFLIVGITLPITSHAQKSGSGIFSTAEDYQKNSITIIADSTQGKAIKIDDFFFRPYVWIKTSAGKRKVPKKNLFAVRMPDKKVYRIVNNENYLLLDTTNIYIYSREKEVNIPITTTYSTRFSRRKVTGYFFSTTKTSGIQVLNRVNVRLGLLRDKQFDNELMAHFQTDESLSVRNENGQFEINAFLNANKK